MSQDAHPFQVSSHGTSLLIPYHAALYSSCYAPILHPAPMLPQARLLINTCTANTNRTYKCP